MADCTFRGSIVILGGMSSRCFLFSLLVRPLPASQTTAARFSLHFHDSFPDSSTKVLNFIKFHSKCPNNSPKTLQNAFAITIVPTESRKQLTNINGYTREVWQELIRAHVSKMNYLVNRRFELPNKIESQELIFEKQLEKHILHKCPKVAVLSAFPVYVLDYFGADTLKEKLEE